MSSVARARAARAQDIPACVGLMGGNVPRYFTAGEPAEFEPWLRADSSPFLVVELGGEIVACGGYTVDESRCEPAQRGFYERHGFRAVAETPDGYGPGLDRIDMRLSV